MNILPTVMVILSIGSALMYGIAGDLVRALYWCGSSMLIASTLMMKG